jgi:hypothetical protein
MWNRFVLTLAVTAGLAFAQNKEAPGTLSYPSPPVPDIIRVIEVKQADVGELAAIIQRVTGGLAAITPDSTRRVLIVRGQEAGVKVVEDAVRRLDVPAAAQPAPPNVELTVYLLYGAATEGRGDPVPQDLASTVKQLSVIFPYKSYRMLETFVLRGRDGQQSQTFGTLPSSRNQYTFQSNLQVVAGPAPQTVRLRNLQLSLRWLDGPQSESGISTELDAREGQKVVVGKSNVIGTDDTLILVVTPKVLP